MKLRFITYLKLNYYFKIFKLMRSFRPHITDKDAIQVYEYWEVVYHNKIVRLLKDKYENF